MNNYDLITIGGKKIQFLSSIIKYELLIFYSKFLSLIVYYYFYRENLTVKESAKNNSANKSKKAVTPIKKTVIFICLLLFRIFIIRNI